MRPIGLEGEVTAGRFPRVSGDAPLAKLLVETLDAFSPRERGCAPRARTATLPSLVFPA